MTIEDSENHELMQIKQAAAGYVSGTLDEWPHLKHALRKRGIKLPNTTNALRVSVVCKTYCEQNRIEF